jgi:copper chaperone CopZ
MRIEGMTCPSCEHHVDKALRATGARSIAADFRRGEALLTVDAPPDAAALEAAVRDAGYTPGPLAPVQTTGPEAEDLVDYRLPVEGMTCADCERHVAEALMGAGADQAEANFRRSEAHVRASSWWTSAPPSAPHASLPRCRDWAAHSAPERLLGNALDESAIASGAGTVRASVHSLDVAVAGIAPRERAGLQWERLDHGVPAGPGMRGVVAVL